MPITCPRCHSEKVETRNHARRTGGAIGATAGAASAMGGAEIGAAAGIVAGPIGSFAGAILGGLIGGLAGYATGAALGEVIDDKVLDNYHCLTCDYNFTCDVTQRVWYIKTYTPFSRRPSSEIPDTSKPT